MSAPNLDRNGRYRSVTVAFRMSHQEADELDALVARLTVRAGLRVVGGGQ